MKADQALPASYRNEADRLHRVNRQRERRLSKIEDYREYQRKWCEANRDRLNAKRRKARARKKAAKAYRLANVDRRRAANKAYYQSHKAEHRIRQRKWYCRNRLLATSRKNAANAAANADPATRAIRAAKRLARRLADLEGTRKRDRESARRRRVHLKQMLVMQIVSKLQEPTASLEVGV